MVPNDAARAANRARFARLIARSEADIDLAASALAIAADDRPDLDPEPTFEGLDRYADLVRLRLDLGDPPDIIIGTLHNVLYRDAGFRAPIAAEYHDPRNSQLDQVVARRVGLPISLAVVELEVAWRLGVELYGIGLPGHFIVGGPDGELIDPAAGGRRLTPDDCQVLLRRALGEGVLFHSGMLRPTGKRQILARIMRNLRSLLTRYLDERPEGHDASDVRQVVGIFAGRRN